MDMVIDTSWDDATLFREMRRTYDKLRSWRRWISLRSVKCITLVWVRRVLCLRLREAATDAIALAQHDEHTVYPQRIEPKRTTRHTRMRLRYYLEHPHELRGKREFIQVLINDPDLGIEFVERWRARRIGLLLSLFVSSSLTVGIVYTKKSGDVVAGFTIAIYMVGVYSMCLALVGVLNLVD